MHRPPASRGLPPGGGWSLRGAFHGGGAGDLADLLSGRYGSSAVSAAGHASEHPPSVLKRNDKRRELVYRKPRSASY